MAQAGKGPPLYCKCSEILSFVTYSTDLISLLGLNISLAIIAASFFESGFLILPVVASIKIKESFLFCTL